MTSADLREELTCSVCTAIYTDPVTLTCGHSFCLVCITKTWDSLEFRRYSCPECRQLFMTKPELKRNMKMCNIVKHFLSLHPEQEEVGIPCTYCIHSPVPAAKLCLHCDASLCENHLKVHSNSMEHILIEPTTSLGKRKCSIHKEILKYHCCEDAVCICVSCRVEGEHKGHHVENLKEASEKMKEKLRNILEKLASKKEEVERKVSGLQKHMREVQERAASVIEGVTALIRGVMEQVEDLEKKIICEVFRQEEQVLLQASNLIQQMELKKEKLSRNMVDIEEVYNKNDPLTVLQGWVPDWTDCYDAEERNNEDMESDNKKVHAVGDLDVGLVSVTLYSGLSRAVTGTHHIVQESSCMSVDVNTGSDMLLDVNTASNNVTVSGDLKTVSRSKISQGRPETPERIEYNQVLSTRGLSSGQHYWEVEVGETGRWIIGMAYPSMVRKGKLSWIGMNNMSWGLLRSYNKQYSVIHDNEEINLLHVASCQRLGIYLDYEVGRLSFYELSDPIRHLHTFAATFTEPLHAGFGVGQNAWVRIRTLNDV
ncbi:E3 ubiquitin-protein ligase TRIM39-like [Pelobates fuscus]|uniref:E3 ubiquitin-protein ligase TRIM39-like n=1 Tax=Pelobates fuscus TaxID=191477 RepID=UPI002FE4E9DC